MIKFFIKIGVLALSLLFFTAIIFTFDYFIIGNQYTESYPASVIDKVSRLENIDEPKIILVGNSNLAFGIDSALLEEQTGMPVVNLGYHGGLSNLFHENLAKFNINAGDIVIICHTSYAGTKTGDYNLEWLTVEKHLNLYAAIPIRDIAGMVINYPKYWMDAFKLMRNGSEEPGDTCYAGKAFSEYGDVVYKPALEQHEWLVDDIVVPSISDAYIHSINRFNTYVSECGATLCVAGYPIMDCDTTPEKDEYEVFQKELAEQLNCRVISNFTDYFMSTDYFYDTIFHLTNEGAKIRTQILIQDIRNAGVLPDIS